MDSLFSQALDKANNGLLIVDQDLRIILWNRWLKRYTGIAQEEVVGQKLTDVCPRFQLELYQKILHSALYHGQSRFCSSTLHKAFFVPKNMEDSSECKQNLYVEPLVDGDWAYALIQVSDVTNVYNKVFKLENLVKKMETEYREIIASEKLSRHLSLHDTLTSLPNRLAFNDRLAFALNYAQRNGDKVAVLFLDVDGFKTVNDRHGHEAGDQVIIEVARRLKACTRSSDTIARFGGDEFVVVLTQLNQVGDASTVADKFVKSFNPPFEIGEDSIHLTISVGISIYPDHGEDPSELIRKADTAMYKIKYGGKNAFGFYEEDERSADQDGAKQNES